MPNSKDELLCNAQILVVDDTPDSLKLLAKILRDAGYTVRPANTGELALASIGKAIPDMVLLDVLMPGMDGYAVCEHLKAKPDTRDIPVIFISALEKAMDKLRGFQVGAVDFITKPYEPSEVLARVSTHLKLHLLQKELEHSNRRLIQEIEKRNSAERLFILEKERFRITLLSIGDGVVTTDNTGYITLLNDAAKNLTGWVDESAVGKPFSEVFNTIDEYTREKCVVPIKEAIKTGRIVGLANHAILIAKNGIEIPITDSVSPIIDTEGCINGVVMVFQNVTKERAKQKEMEFMSYHDLLTGLYNRRFFEEELMRLDTNRNLPITLVMGDVNGLKLINDSFGHAMGDELLKKAAEVIKRGCRADDIIARLGGDEFVILLPKTSTLEAEHIVERISDLSIREKVCGIDISISFGYKTKTKDKEEIAEIFKNAEDHMEEMLFQNEEKGKRAAELVIANNKLIIERIKIEELNNQLESRVTERTAQLETSNELLESFSYSVSHDLRAPLRHVVGFVELLNDHMQETLDDQSRHYLEVISKATIDMGQLIDDLLLFSRIGKTVIESRKVDLNLLIKQVIETFEPEMNRRSIEWDIGILPNVNGDTEMLKLVLSNLISNALKFTSLKTSARIEIGSKPDPENTNQVVFYIKDNGAGFDMQYKEKLFGVFQRLHSQKDFQGTGIGLANVKRVIQRHGGKVWAEGVLEEGAVFYFTLPKYEEEA